MRQPTKWSGQGISYQDLFLSVSETGIRSECHEWDRGKCQKLGMRRCPDLNMVLTIQKTSPLIWSNEFL